MSALSSSANVVIPILAAATNRSSTKAFAAVGFSENDHFIRLALDLPTVDAKDISVELQRGVLLVRGSREVNLGANVRHEHKFCRRFAMDTDVVNSERIQANLNERGVLTIMAPKMRLPSTVHIAVTEHEDSVFEASITKSFQQQQQQATEEEEEKSFRQQQREKAAEEEAKGEQRAVAASEKQQSEKTGIKIAPKKAASLPNVVSMASATEAIQDRKAVTNKRKHRSSLQSHLMIRRSMSNLKPRKNKKSG